MAGAVFHINGSSMIHSLPKKSNLTRPSLLSRRTMAVSAFNSQSKYWSSLNDEVDAHLKQGIPIKPPLSVYEPMHHLTFSAPQTAAPALCLAACELVGGHRDQALPAASALRLLHAAAFTHEHLLALEDILKPGNRAKVTHVYGPNIELLTGDGMIPFGMEILAESDDPAKNGSDRILRVIIEMTRTMGSQGMVEGLYKELQCGEGSVHIASITEVCKKKEGQLHACAGACGAIIGGGNEEEIERLRRYGLHIGMMRGLFNSVERKDKLLLEELEDLRTLALNELRGFDQAKVEKISSIIDLH